MTENQMKPSQAAFKEQEEQEEQEEDESEDTLRYHQTILCDKSSQSTYQPSTHGYLKDKPD